MARTKDISRNDILNIAQRFIEELGFNGFSIRDLSAEVDISSASLHHHFPTKADLMCAVIARYREDINQRFGQIEAELDELQSRVQRLRTEMNQLVPQGIILVAVMAADFNTLPAEVQAEAQILTTNIFGWLTRFVTQAKNQDELTNHASVESIVMDSYAKLLGEALLSRGMRTDP